MLGVGVVGVLGVGVVSVLSAMCDSVRCLR